MSSHVHARLYDGFVTVSRLVAHLHALSVDVDQLHVSGEWMCVRLANARDARRVRTVLARCPDAVVDAVDDRGDVACPHTGEISQPSRTTYVVWSEPLNEVRRSHRRSRITA